MNLDRAVAGIIHPVVLVSAFAVLWFLCLFCIFPIGLGAVDPETGAPLKPRLGLKALWATAIAAVLWLVFYFVLRAGWIDL
jgi:predicted secreted protein